MKPMFKVGDKVRLRKGLIEGNYADESGNKDCCLSSQMIKESKDKILTIKEVSNYFNSGYRYELEEIDYSWTCEMLELVKKRNIQLEDLKDGMEIFMENGSYKRIVINNGKNYISFDDNWHGVLSINMLFPDGEVDSNVKKITYMGEVIYKKEKKEVEYMTLKEAFASKKAFKHKDAKNYYYLLSSVIKEAEDVIGDEGIIDEPYKKVWEVKED